jgi:glycosyltransferase involved in cell wall biosynthesis
MVQLRKNLGRLLRAYEILLDGQRDLDLQLVLAGPYGWGSEQIRQEAEKLVARGKVIFTGPLTDPELSLLVKGASLCVIPSLYEGFCLPMLEAMACGVATIASNSSCLPEVSGGVLRYFDPMSAEDIAETIRQVWGSRELREKLAGDGLKRASEFSWTRCAQETLMALTGMDARRAAMSN